MRTAIGHALVALGLKGLRSVEASADFFPPHPCSGSSRGAELVLVENIIPVRGRSFVSNGGLEPIGYWSVSIFVDRTPKLPARSLDESRNWFVLAHSTTQANLRLATENIVACDKLNFSWHCFALPR